MTDDELTFASAGIAGVHYACCWPCTLQSCPGGWHTWADEIDVQHAANTGQPDPSTKRCGCPCAEGPVLDRSDADDIDRYDDDTAPEPCYVCGESGACGYDALGRVLIHAYSDADEPPFADLGEQATA